jgi:hypothetical protein
MEFCMRPAFQFPTISHHNILDTKTWRRSSPRTTHSRFQKLCRCATFVNIILVYFGTVTWRLNEIEFSWSHTETAGFRRSADRRGRSASNENFHSMLHVRCTFISTFHLDDTAYSAVQFKNYFRLVPKVVVCRFQALKPGSVDSRLYGFRPELLVFIEIISERLILLFIHPSIRLSSRVWHYSSFWALAFFRRRLNSSLSAACFLQPRIPRTCNASLWTTPSHRILRFPADLVLWGFPLRTPFLGSFLLQF